MNGYKAIDKKRLPDELVGEPQLVHQFNNHLCVISGFCHLLLNEMSDTDPRRADILEIQKAAQAALALLPTMRTACADRHATAAGSDPSV
jgi:hypothetical protein